MNIEDLADQASYRLVKCYELTDVSIPKNPDLGGRYRITYLPVGGNTYYLYDELMGNPNYNSAYLVDTETYPGIETDSGRCFGFIVETVIFANDDRSESIRLVTAANNARKGYYLVRFGTRTDYDAYQDPASVKWAVLKKPEGSSETDPATPVSYSDVQIKFAVENLHPPFEEDMES